MENENQTPHKRRVHYKGKYPKKFEEKYKELQPEKYKDTIAHVIQKGNTPAGMHISIMVKEILDFLQIKPGQTGFDATLGYGGHTKAMLEQLQGQGHIHATDVDPVESAKTKKRLAEQGFGEDSALRIYRSATVSFTDIEGNTIYTVFAGTVQDLLEELDVTLSDGQLITYPLDTILKDGMDVRVTNSYDVSVTADGTTNSFTMGEGTVRDALNRIGVTLGDDDEVSPELDSEVCEGTAITVYRVSYSYRTVTETVEFTKKTEKSAELYTDQQVISQKGVNGSKKVTYCDKTVDGKYASSEAVTTVVLEQAVPQITTVGTKQRPIVVRNLKNNGSPISELTVPSSINIENGAPTSYSKIITGKASAYTASPTAKTSTGRTVKAGYVAVNPKQIPYGSELWIVSTDGIVYGYAIAADTGGFIHKGKFTVDLFMNTESECRQWGARDVIIYVL